MAKLQLASRGAGWHRGLVLGLVAIAVMAVAVIAVGAAGITQATKCKNTLLSCSATSDQAECRRQYGQCAINSYPLVVTCIFLLMATTVVGMLVHVWWTKQQQLMEQQQEQAQQQALADAAAAAEDADAAGDAASGPDADPDAAAAAPQPLYSKVWDIPGLILFLCFVAASVFYFAIRITKSLNTAEHTWYPILLLVVELFGYTAMLPYAWMLVRYSRIRPSTPEESSALLGLHGPGVTPIAFPPTTFHVMVPCYTEESENFEEDGIQDIPMIRGTLEAILSCFIPPGCRMTVTLCDDGQRKVDGLVGPARTDEGKAKQLAKFGALAKARAGLAAQLEAMFPGDAGRLFKRVCRPAKYPNSDKQTNGKSANVNWALRQAIYGGNRRPQPEDVIVIFDCDHRPKPHFFTRVLQVMTETQADLVLTPQFFSNTEAGADIFNNDNKQFWKYLLPGYDASDYIACTGTNFAIRAVALQQAGWFPDNTVTEDYALSLKLKTTVPKKQEPNPPSKLGLGPGAGQGAPSYSAGSGHMVGGASYSSNGSNGSGLYRHPHQQQQVGLADVAGVQQLPSAPPAPAHLYNGNPAQQQQQQQQLLPVPQYGPRSYQQQQQGEQGDVRASWSSVASARSAGPHPTRTSSSSMHGIALQPLKRGGPRSSSPAEQVSDCYLHRRSHEEEGAAGAVEEEEEVVQYNAVVYDGEDALYRGSPDQQQQRRHSQHHSWGGAGGPDIVAQVHPSEAPGWGAQPPAAAAAARAPPQPTAAAAAPVRRRRRFVGRYLNEHLATGLAPVEPRPWFQQRSRWTKGHFEVLFNPSACPLAFWRYTGNLAERLYASILYMIGTWSYITNFVSTPVFFLVPFFYLVLGLAPIAFTWELGVAASIYLPLSQLMMGYVRDIKDAKSIWLAGISNTVLSFTYFKAFLNTALTAMGFKPKGGFKPTMGAAAAIAQALDPVVLLLYLVVNLASMALGMYMIISQLLPIKGYSMLLEYAAAGTINLNLFMPIFWACHNTVAPLVFFAYVASFNRDIPDEPPGRHYQRFVTAMWIFDTTCLAGALGCLWWSIILPNQGAQRSLFDILADYASGLYASALAG